MSYVYSLRCADGSLYLGETEDVQARFGKHNEGRASRFTASRRPVALVYLEDYATVEAARVRERQIKGWTRAKKEALVAGDLSLLKRI